MTKTTDTKEIPSTNMASGMTAAFSGGMIKSFGKIQISKFAAVLMRPRRAVCGDI